MQMYPGWSARDNYATRTKKKKMKRDVSTITSNYETKLGILPVCCLTFVRCGFFLSRYYVNC